MFVPCAEFFVRLAQVADLHEKLHGGIQCVKDSFAHSERRSLMCGGKLVPKSLTIGTSVVANLTNSAMNDVTSDFPTFVVLFPCGIVGLLSATVPPFGPWALPLRDEEAVRS